MMGRGGPAMPGHGQGMMGRGQGMMGSGKGMMGRGPGPMGPGKGMMGRGPAMPGRGPGMMGPGKGMMGPGKGMMDRGPGRGTCDPVCRCPNRGGPECRGPGDMPGCRCPMHEGKQPPCPMREGKPPCPMGEARRPEGPPPMGGWGRERPEGPPPMPWREGPGREEGPPPWVRGDRERPELPRGSGEEADRVREQIESLRGRIRERAEAFGRDRPEGRHEEREERREGPPEGRPEGRGPDMPDNPLGMLLSPRVREELRLSDEQVERIEEMTRNMGRHMEEVLAEARAKMERAGPEEREELGRRIRMEAQEARERMMLRIREALTDILRPEQREKVEQLLRRRGQEGPGGPTGAMPPAPPAEGDRPYRPAVQEAPATFRLIQDQGPGIRVWVNGQPVEAQVQVESPSEGRDQGQDHGDRGRWAGGQGSQNLGQMSDEERQARIQQMRSRYLFQMLRDEDLRAEAGITPIQERKIESLIKEYDEEQKRIEADIRKQFADRGGDGEDAQRREYDMRREIGIATRDAQPLLDSIADQAVGLLSDEQKERLQAASQERNRLRMACGDLYLLTTKRAAKAIGIESGQQARIRAVLKEGLGRQTERYEAMRESYRDIIEEIRNMPPEQREEAVRSRWQEAMKFRDEGITDTRGRVFEILTPSQRDKAEQFLEEAKKEQGGGLMQGGGWMRGGGMPGGGSPGGPAGPGAPGPQGAAPTPDAVRQAEGRLV